MACDEKYSSLAMRNDALAPELRAGEVAMIAETRRFTGDGLYLIEGEGIHRLGNRGPANIVGRVVARVTYYGTHANQGRSA